jgi:hypothetical protein
MDDVRAPGFDDRWFRQSATALVVNTASGDRRPAPTLRESFLFPGN